MTQVDFKSIKRAALHQAVALLNRWLPGGKLHGKEYVVRNPKRLDRQPGSFKINTSTGKWGDFAINQGGGDLISLRAYLDGVGQMEAAQRIAAELSISSPSAANARRNQRRKKD
ncbi:hypothetical protein [Desulfoferula mesophila]|uniref:DNA primase n=1 Tax=Desulfoferula mesophila TaxID=3058419 RepID=A0AAU9ETH5_9BACT|nr:hypothetical protein FAK_01890 [Desulfoferula mesophilus]